MLSRCAQGLYWASRYLERAEHLCRLMGAQVQVLVDRPVREIYFGWRRIYSSLACAPLTSELEPETGEDYALVDSYMLADNLTFEQTNPHSLLSCIALGRENARQMRHYISSEMWTCLNLLHLKLKKIQMQDIWGSTPETFYAQTSRDIYAFWGVSDATMYRDQGWRFMRLGGYIERIQILCPLLLVQLELDKTWDDSQEIKWKGLLHVMQATDAYDRTHGFEIDRQSILDLLVTDSLFPHSLCNALDALAQEVETLAIGHWSSQSQDIVRLIGRSCALVRYDWMDCQNPEDFLRGIYANCCLLHDKIMSTYVDYAVEQSPVL